MDRRAPGRLTAAHAAPPPSGLRRRLLRIVYEWPIAISLFCEIFMAFIGATFIVNTFHRTIPPTSPWFRWGAGGLLVFGVLFLGLGLYGACFRERMTGLVPSFLLVGLALPTAVARGDVLGVVFYALFLGGALAEAHTRWDRAALRRDGVARARRDAPWSR